MGWSFRQRGREHGGYRRPVDPAHELAALVATGSPPLDRSLALIAAAGRPAVDVEALLRRLDHLAALVPGDDAVSLCAGVFGGAGRGEEVVGEPTRTGGLRFEGNRRDYYDPDNSLLDQVLDRRTGIPITLAVLGMELGRRRGVDLLGIGMPGHFLLRAAADPELFLDPFDGGRPLDPEGCRRLFRVLHGASAAFSESYLEPTGPVDIVVRVLNNLRVARLRRGDRHGLADVLRLQVALPGSGLGDRRQLAGVLAADGRFLEAAALHDELVEEDHARADEHRAAAVRLRANLN